MSDTLTTIKRRSLQRQLDALVQEYESISNAITNDNNPVSRTRLERSLEEKGAEIAKVDAQIAALGPAAVPVTPPVAPDPLVTPGPLVTDRVMLRTALIDHFKIEELKILCADLGIDFENLGGSGKAGTALELVQYMERRGRIGELAAKIRKERPNAGI